MALIKCPECGREISDRAAACIHCGCPLPTVRPASADSGNAQKAADGSSDSRSAILRMDFDAVVSGPESASTSQSVFVKELGRNVEFAMLNTIQVGHSVKVELSSGPYSHVIFRAARVLRRPDVKPAAAAAPKINGKSYDEIKEIVKEYEPNGFIQFLYSRRFYTIVVLIIGLVVKLFMEDGLYGASIAIGGTAFVSVPLLLARFLYPMHHLKKYFRKHHIEKAIRNDSGYMNISIAAYNLMPGKRMLAYIKKLNEEAGERIEKQLAAAKKK